MKEPALVQVVSGCVLKKDNKYLLVQEKLPKAYGLWNLPAGKVDIGETIEQAAVREVFEETGYTVKLETKVNLEHPGIDRAVLHAFKAQIIDGDLTISEDELLDAQWFAIEEVRIYMLRANFAQTGLLTQLNLLSKLLGQKAQMVYSRLLFDLPVVRCQVFVALARA